MKKLMIILILLPFWAIGQNHVEYRVFDNVILTPIPDRVEQLENGIAAHNKKHHTESDFGVLVYRIASGPRFGSYVWNMGSMPWSALDYQPEGKGDHDEDWNKNIEAYVIPGGGNQTYWKFNTDLSRFPKDFTLTNLHVTFYDVNPGKWKEAMELVGKVLEVYDIKMPDQAVGIYTNEMPSTKEGKDIAVISFFEKWAWMGEDSELRKNYDEVHGTGSFDQFIEDWTKAIKGSESELWIYLPKLSSKSGEVKAMPIKK